ncbi:hypothetical protein Q9233_008258, partial [Columba guinea]
PAGRGAGRECCWARVEHPAQRARLHGAAPGGRALSRRRGPAAGRLGAERAQLDRFALGVRRPPPCPQRGILHRRRADRGGGRRSALGGGQGHPGGLRLRCRGAVGAGGERDPHRQQVL